MPGTKDQEPADRINALTPLQLKTFEDRMRRMAKRQGLILLKSRRRDPRAYDFGGYMIADEDNHPVAGASPRKFSMSLDDVERYLTADKPRKGGGRE